MGTNYYVKTNPIAAPFIAAYLCFKETRQKKREQKGNPFPFWRNLWGSFRDTWIRIGKDYHIGKSSVGWAFSLHVTLREDNPGGYFPTNLADYSDWFSSWGFRLGCWSIRSEYRDKVSPARMMEIILLRRGRSSSDRPAHWTPEYLEANFAVPGPYGLLRHKIDNYHCIGHGMGTFDYLVGDFS